MSIVAFLQAHFDLKIPKEHHRFVIGRQGEKLKTIELQTATKVQGSPYNPHHNYAHNIPMSESGVRGVKERVSERSEEWGKRNKEKILVCVKETKT